MLKVPCFTPALLVQRPERDREARLDIHCDKHFDIGVLNLI